MENSIWKHVLSNNIWNMCFSKHKKMCFLLFLLCPLYWQNKEIYMCILIHMLYISWFSWWLIGQRICLQCRRHRRCEFDPYIGKISWRSKSQPTPVFLPEKSHRQRSLFGFSPWDHRTVGYNWVQAHIQGYLFSSIQLLSRVQLFATLRTVARQAPLSMGFFRQEYWSGLPFLSPRDLPGPEIEPGSPAFGRWYLYCWATIESIVVY